MRARAPQRAGLLTGAFSTSLVTGATIATFTAIPFEDAFGGWEPALAFWALPALVAAAVWIPLAIRAHDPVAVARRRTPLWSDPMAWSIALFMGLQSMAFFSTITWLPEMLEADGFSEGYAGRSAGITQLVQIVPAFAIPVLAGAGAHADAPAGGDRRHGAGRPARRPAGARTRRCCGWSSSASARAARSGSG